jgi:very-short-patch-repair endonuclease
VKITPPEAQVYVEVDFQTSRRRTAQLAGRQYGHATRRQLLDEGVPSTTIDAWIRDGVLLRVHQGVYAVTYRRVEPVARAMAAVLATGPGSVLSHDSALALWGLRRWPPQPEVIAPRHVRRPGIIAHRSTTLTRADMAVELGVATTRVARALHDISARITTRQRIRLTNQARLERLISAEEAQRLLGHARNPTRSGLEDAFQRWLEHHHLPQPETNATIDGHEVDALYRAQRLIIELDDYGTHGDAATFQSDRDRDFSHLELGYDTIRLTPERLTDATAQRLRRRLDRRDQRDQRDGSPA